MFLDGPIEASISASEFDGSTHPKYVEMFPRHRASSCELQEHQFCEEMELTTTVPMKPGLQ